MQLLFVNFLFIFSSTFSPIEVPIEFCSDLKCNIEITNTTEGLDNGKITVNVIYSSSKIKAYLYGISKSNNKLKVEIDKLTNLKPGTYYLVLQNSKCSIVKRDIIIQ